MIPGQEDPLKKEIATHRGTWWATVHGVARMGRNLATKLLPPSPQSYYAVHKASRTYSFYNWRFVPSDQYLHISLLPSFG